MQALLKMIQKFEKTGSFDEQHCRGRKRIGLTVVKEVATALKEESGGNVKPCSNGECSNIGQTCEHGA